MTLLGDARSISPNSLTIAQNWSKQTSEAFRKADETVSSTLLGDIDPMAAKAVLSNQRLLSDLARIAEVAGYALLKIETKNIGSSENPDQSAAHFNQKQIMEAAVALVAAGPMIDIGQRKALIANFSEPLIQEVWNNFSALLARLAADDFMPLVNAEPEERAQALADYISVSKPDQRPFTLKLSKIPVRAWDEAFVLSIKPKDTAHNHLKTTGLSA